MKGSIKKDKKTGKYFYVIDMGIDPLTGKRIQKKNGFNAKKEAFNSCPCCVDRTVEEGESRGCRT